MRIISSLNDAWTFHVSDAPELTRSHRPGEIVRLPHTAVELPFNYFDETVYQRVFTYQRVIELPSDFAENEVSLVFDGAMANAVVFVNGREAGSHSDGYTPFEIPLNTLVKPGANLIAVRIDGSENPEIPPFGGQIDYLTHAGIYRDVWLKTVPAVSIDKVKIETDGVLSDRKSVKIRCDLRDPRGSGVSGEIKAVLRDKTGAAIRSVSAPVPGPSVELVVSDLVDIKLWDVDDPELYEATLELTTPGGSDAVATRFGFRTAEFTTRGFLLNGRPLKIRGLNRHQAFPYTGYAMGKRVQERDAEILKRELGVNLVRTSHYPQSPWFLDACDRLGLLVFEEIPGWQHIGGELWKKRAVDNVRAMIERDWNHPSIVLWGVRINESQDDHDFYVETNRVAHELDGTRQTGGVRFITDSELLEDVYTMNDFVLGSETLPGANGARVPTRDQREVTGLPNVVPYMITEFNGHMHPTKIGDQEQWQIEHVTRHLDIIDSVYGADDKSGCVGWCMNDYNTHKDFGSGDRICHHGVLNMFREPKFAAFVYASQRAAAQATTMKPVTFWARGEREIGGVLPLIVLTNCDEVELRYGNGLIKRVGPDRERWPHLPHAPVVFDHRHFSADELRLWGMRWEDGTLIGFVDGKVVATLKMVADPVADRLEIKADDAVLSAEAGDQSRVIVRALDQVGNILPFIDESVTIAVRGPGKLLGPSLSPLRGGVTGFWVETTGGGGDIVISVSSPRFPTVTTTVRTE